MVRPLTEIEMSKPYVKYLDLPYPEIPEEVIAGMREPLDPDKVLHIHARNDLLNEGYLQGEIGYCILPDGSGYVASLTKMPGVTLEMLEWWFVWHGIESLRYRIWDPDDHYEARVTPRHLKKRLDTSLSLVERNWDTSDFVYENVGDGASSLRISFRSPEAFGFDMDRFVSQPVTAICAHSGPPDEAISRTVFIHFARQTPEGIELRSRFWLGWMILNKKAVRTDFEVDPRRVAGLGRHSPREFHRLAKYLPQIYTENKDRLDRFEDLKTIDFSQ